MIRSLTDAAEASETSIENKKRERQRERETEREREWDTLSHVRGEGFEWKETTTRCETRRVGENREESRLRGSSKLDQT